MRSCFERAARGDGDRDVARDLALPIHTVRGILTNPIYVGRLRDGSPASVEPLVDVATWNRVQQLRSERNSRGGRPAVNRTYLLPMLACAACGRGLVGDSGRYRHLDPCAAFTAARPRSAYRNRLHRVPGHSYRRSVYEDLVPLVLRKVALSLDAVDLSRAAELWQAPAPMVDELALRRLEADRDRVLARYREHRDPARLEADMARLDEREAAAKAAHDVSAPDWSEALQLLRDVPAMWADRDADDLDRRRLAIELFSSVEALGARRTTWNFRSGAQAVVDVGAKGVKVSVSMNGTPLTLAELA
ncbi:MAG TPA: recombinase family protein [Candidatus Saccharimonadales bacterium]|nr:recombinase family protein [Candidatus Saccharimonadales bacterium]